MISSGHLTGSTHKTYTGVGVTVTDRYDWQSRVRVVPIPVALTAVAKRVSVRKEIPQYINMHKPLRQLLALQPVPGAAETAAARKATYKSTFNMADFKTTHEWSVVETAILWVPQPSRALLYIGIVQPLCVVLRGFPGNRLHKQGRPLLLASSFQGETRDSARTPFSPEISKSSRLGLGNAHQRHGAILACAIW